MRVALEPSTRTLLFAILLILSLVSVVVVHPFLQHFEVAISKRRDLLLTWLAVRTTAFWNRWPFENCRAAFTCSPLWALTMRRFGRSADRRGAGPRMAAVLGRRS